MKKNTTMGKAIYTIDKPDLMWSCEEPLATISETLFWLPRAFYWCPNFLYSCIIGSRYYSSLLISGWVENVWWAVEMSSERCETPTVTNNFTGPNFEEIIEIVIYLGRVLNVSCRPSHFLIIFDFQAWEVTPGLKSVVHPNTGWLRPLSVQGPRCWAGILVCRCGQSAWILQLCLAIDSFQIF